MPSRGPTLLLQTTAMACDFDVMLNPDDRHQLDAASMALDLVHEREQQLSVYRSDSELSDLNRQACLFSGRLQNVGIIRIAGSWTKAERGH